MPTYHFRCIYTKAGVGAAPASAPTVDICDGVGTLVETNKPATALSGITGLYAYTYVNDTPDEYVAVFKTTDATFDPQHIGSWTPTVDATLIADEIRRQAAITVRITSPAASNGNLRLTVNKNYLAGNGRAIDFIITGWPSLIGATVTLDVRTTPETHLAGTVLNASSCRFEVTATQLNTIGVAAWVYILSATLASGITISLPANALEIVESEN